MKTGANILIVLVFLLTTSSSVTAGPLRIHPTIIGILRTTQAEPFIWLDIKSL